MEKIYMIPVNYAYNEACGCPICRLRDKAETNYLEYYLGPSLMEPDTRKITNKTGFCPVHMGKLNQAVTNRLGLGLVMHTHLKDFHEELDPKLKASIPAKAGLLKGRNSDYKQKFNSVADLIEKRIGSCPICDNLNEAMGHYIEVICWMFSHDHEFKEKFMNAEFHCLPHTALLLRQAAKLSQNEASDFVDALYNNNSKTFEALISDVEYFTLKFDYRNTDKPWGTSKDSIQRSMRFLSSDGRDFDVQQTKKQS